MSVHPATADTPGGWHRPVRPGALLAVAVSLLVLWLALMVGGVMWFYAHFESHITVREQAVRLRLPSGLPALAEVSSPLTLQVPSTLRVRVMTTSAAVAACTKSCAARLMLFSGDGRPNFLRIGRDIHGSCAGSAGHDPSFRPPRITLSAQ